MGNHDVKLICQPRVFVNGRSRAVIVEDMQARINRGDIQMERHEAINVCLVFLKYRMDADKAIGNMRYCCRSFSKIVHFRYNYLEECKPGISTDGIHAGLTTLETPVFSARSCRTSSSRSLKQSFLKEKISKLKHTMRHRDLVTFFVVHQKFEYFFAGAKYCRLFALVAAERFKVTVVIGIRVVR